MHVEIPSSFLAQPRWWTEGREWLEALPELIIEQCRSWELIIDGTPRHGSNALVLPVRRVGEDGSAGRVMLRMSPPDERTRSEIAALDFWAGRGTVLQLAADPKTGASLLERLDADRGLSEIGLAESAVVLGTLMRRLAVPVPSTAAAPRKAEVVARRITELDADWDELGQPMDHALIATAIAAAEPLIKITATVAVNGDLHHDQVLAGSREPWLVVDPMLMVGDIGYDLARCLWWRLDEMADDRVINEQVAIIARAAGLDLDHARAGALYRAVDYWLWGLKHGLTEDPVRCARLCAAHLSVS